MQIMVTDIAHWNTVIGIGTTLHKFKVDGNDIYLPCLSYHLPSAEVWLYSPQTFHTVYGGHSTVNGNEIKIFINHLRVHVKINCENSNAPMIFDCSVSAKEMCDTGPFIRSALTQYEHKVDFLGGWSSSNYKDWKLASMTVDKEYGHYCCSGSCALLNVATESI